MRCAEAEARLGESASTSNPDSQSDSKVRDDGLASLQQHIAGLDVAVNHALAVSIVECLGHIGGNLDSITDRKLMLAVEPVL